MPIYMKNLNYQIRGFSGRDQMVVGYHVYLIQLYIIKVVWCFCKVFQFFLGGEIAVIFQGFQSFL